MICPQNRANALIPRKHRTLCLQSIVAAGNVAQNRHTVHRGHQILLGFKWGLIDGEFSNRLL